VRIYDPLTSAEVAELKGHTNLVRTVQAGFGDLPGNDRADEVRAAEKKYLEDLANGVLVDSRESRRGVRSVVDGTSRYTFGSKLPPGGGGSKWGRIVSGSYDESIIIWRKNARGDWVIGQMLRQESPSQAPPSIRPRVHAPIVLPPPPPVLIQPAVGPVGPLPHQAQPPLLASNPGPAGIAQPAVMSASQIVQQAMNSSLASFGGGLANVTGLGRALNGTGEPSSSSRSNVNLTITGNSAQSIAQQAAAQTQATISQAMNAAFAQARSQQQLQNRQQSGGSNAGSSTSGQHLAQHPQTGPSPAAVVAQQLLSQSGPVSAPAALPAPSRATATWNPPPPPIEPSLPVPTAQPPLAMNPGHASNVLPIVPAAPAAAVATVAAAAQSSVSRVFKLQFDARRIVCCSQDSRIVGWDFANDDPEVVEACRFFVGP
jgi:F-box and WD-40 domain protein 1/11